MAPRKKAAKAAQETQLIDLIIPPNGELMWTPSMAAVPWKEAGELAKACRLGGFDDWRLPTPHELFGLVVHSRFLPACDTKLFPDMKSEAYWTSAPLASASRGYAWVVYFSDGDVDDRHQGGKAFVRLVRSLRASQ